MEKNGIGKRPSPSGKRKDDDSSACSSSDDDDELALDGVIKRNSDASTSSEESEVEDSDDDGDNKKSGSKTDQARGNVKNNDKKPSALEFNNNRNDASRQQQQKIKNKKKKRKSDSDDGILQVEFTFCDMNEIYFHGIKSLLFNSATVYQQYDTELSDAIIENVSVGTVISTTEQYSDIGTVFGYASVLNINTYENSDSIKFLINDICIKYCSNEYMKELKTIFASSSSSKQHQQQVGILMHGRMLNLPIHMVSILHEQLIQDINWAISNAEGGVEEQKSFDFDYIIRIAPFIHDKKTHTSYYKYFDDEIFATNSIIQFECPAPPPGSSSDYTMSSSGGVAATMKSDNNTNNNNDNKLSVIIMTKSGHRKAVEELKKMVN